MTARTVWAAVVEVRDDRGVHMVEVGTYATAREASAIAARAIVRIATPVAVEVEAHRCACGCGCDYRLDDYGAGEVTCGACVDVCAEAVVA